MERKASPSEEMVMEPRRVLEDLLPVAERVVCQVRVGGSVASAAAVVKSLTLEAGRNFSCSFWTKTGVPSNAVTEMPQRVRARDLAAVMARIWAESVVGAAWAARWAGGWAGSVE